MAEASIVAALRTAGGKRKGNLSGWHPVDLAGRLIDGLLDHTGIDPAAVEAHVRDPRAADAGRLWTLLLLEQWHRAFVGG